MNEAKKIVIKFVAEDSPYFTAMVRLMEKEVIRRTESNSAGKYVVKISDGFTTGVYTLKGGIGEYSINNLIHYITDNSLLKITSEETEPKLFDWEEE